MQFRFIQYHSWIFLCFLGFFLIACAPESKYAGGNGAFKSYESLNAYGEQTIKYKDDYMQPQQSSFSNGLVANDRENIRSTPQNRATQGSRTTKTKSGKTKGVSADGKTTQTTTSTQGMQSPVQGDGSFTPTKSLLEGMRDSEAIQRATMKPYTVRGKTYYPKAVKVGDSFEGIASWYGPDFHSKATSNGETYNMYAHTAANKTLPMNTIVKVYNKDNGKTTVVRINDRGPFVETRIIDLSNIAAHDIEMVGKGIANVRIEVVGFGGDLANNKPPKETSDNTIAMQNANKQDMPKTESRKKENTPIKDSNTTDSSIKNSDSNAKDSNTPATKTNQPAQQGNIPQSNNQTQPQSLAQADSPKQTENVMQPPENAIIEEAIEVELPPFEEHKNAKPDSKRNIEPKQTPQNQESLDTTLQQIPQKVIENADSINKDLDNAIQKLKDSTNELQEQQREAIKPKPQTNEKLAQPNNQQSETAKPQTNENAKPKESENLTQPKPQSPDKQQTNGKFMVSLNVFSQEERARKFMEESILSLKEKMQDKNYQISIVPTDKGLYRVALRGFQTQSEAKEFIAQHKIAGHVVAEN